ncbi:hypothetical protein EW146_g6435 [Bondarzewia mesenterica]|uniref:Xylose isomerase-like TIM barrel domain-containing protein n=1 Tax=Bondarzewia mesenterica TaxID=1095465 RepID=A0A4S4LP73_9AGAM|nr:hypothetical protein EW146_g6435 [Bondarzewia mesenterica]
MVSTRSSARTKPDDNPRPSKRAKSQPEEPGKDSAKAVPVTKSTSKKGKDRAEPSESLVHSPQDYPQRAKTPWKVGAHVSAAGGVENAILNAASLGANAFALFLKSQRKWTGPPMSETSVSTFRSRLAEFDYAPEHILPHGSYLMNLGNPDAEKREKSYQCFLEEIRRCEQLSLRLYNFHPGSTVGQATKDESISLIAEGINRAHRETKQVITIIENMAGAGNVIGGKFEEIAGIIERVMDKDRVGVCLDTCWPYVWGGVRHTHEGTLGVGKIWPVLLVQPYFNVNASTANRRSTMDQFDKVVGIKYLRGMHLNDSKTPLGSKKDRHENIGLGALTIHAFAHILSDKRTQGIPLILETPAHSGVAVWRAEIAALHEFALANPDYSKAERNIRDTVKAHGKASDEKASSKAERRKAKCEKEDGDDLC